jgi:hypothetical protein
MQLKNSISASYIASDRNDRFNDAFRIGNGLNTETSSNVELFSVRTQYQMPLVTTFNFARNDNEFAGGANNFKFNYFGGTAEYSFFNQKLRTYSGINFTSASGINLTTTAGVTDTTSVTDYTRFDFNLGARFEFAPGHSVIIDGHLIRFNDNGGTFDFSTNPTGVFVHNPSFTDRIFRFYYEKRF